MEEMKREDLQVCLDDAREKLACWKQKGVSLDLTRGKPSRQQLDLASPILEML